MSIASPEIAEKVRAFLATMPHIPAGLGTKEEACSIASVNLALTGKLTDDIPDCMSEAIGSWIIPIQDAMPDEMRNSVEWREALCLAAGTGSDPEKEKARRDLILDWMWGAVLPQLQPLADNRGFGAEWRTMTTERTTAAANALARAAYSSAYHAAATHVAAATDVAAAASAYSAAAATSHAALAAAYSAALSEFFGEYWDDVDPVGLLTKLVAL